MNNEQTRAYYGITWLFLWTGHWTTEEGDMVLCRRQLNRRSYIWEVFPKNNLELPVGIGDTMRAATRNVVFGVMS